MKRLLALILAVLLSLLLLTGCSDNHEISALLSSFQNACQEMDVEKMLECIDPRVSQFFDNDVVNETRNSIKGFMEYFGIETNESDTILQMIFSFADDYTGTELEEMCKTLKISAKEYNFNEEKDQCEVSAIISYKLNNEKTEKTMNFYCVKTEDRWYISSPIISSDFFGDLMALFN